MRASCPWCGSEERRFLIVDDGVPVVACVSCGIAYALVIPTLEAIRRYYTEQFSDERHWEVVLSSARPWLHRRLLSRIMHYRAQGELVDIGCSFGHFASMARRVGYKVVGVEISEPAAMYARTRMGLSVHIGTLEEAKFNDESFDVVTLIDVLEHIVEPAKTLHEVRRILRRGGLLVLRVPNFKFHWIKTLLLRAAKMKHFIGLDSRNHINHFTVRSLTDGLTKMGFKILEVRPGAPNIYGRRFFDALRIAYWAVALLVNAVFKWQIGNSIEVFALKA
jgi:2-polyprenyl-3-methyl-5-hydroxy-6-metoxy-1,4-benzoquinol methylase